MDSIFVKDVSKKFHGVEVIKNLSFSVEQNSIFGFLGPNGAGKSTTLHMLSTLLHKTTGKIYINGMDMDSSKRRIKEQMGVVFQEDVLDPELTVEENLYYRGGLYITTKEELKERLEWVLEEFKLSDLLEKPYGKCSGGQRRMTQIARAVLMKPRILILDEPTTGLDLVSRRQVWEILKLLRREEKMTILFTTHYMEEADYADDLCILKEGNIIACGKQKDLFKGFIKDRNITLEEGYLEIFDKGRD